MSIVISPMSVMLELSYAVDNAPNIELDRKTANTIHPTKLVILAQDGAVIGVCVYGWTVRKGGTFGAMRPVSWNRYDLNRMPDWLQNIVASEATKGGHHFDADALKELKA